MKTKDEIWFEHLKSHITGLTPEELDDNGTCIVCKKKRDDILTKFQVFGLATCHNCKQLLKALDELNVEYDYKEVTIFDLKKILMRNKIKFGKKPKLAPFVITPDGRKLCGISEIMSALRSMELIRRDTK